MPTFSALLSIYKNDKYEFVRDCIDSLINQKGAKFDEIMVIVEGQINQEILGYLIENKSGLIKYYILDDVRGPLNYGLPSCLNFGIYSCTSDYIVRIDSDDISTSNRLVEIQKFTKGNPDVALFGSQIQEFDETMFFPSKKRLVPTNHSSILSYGKFRNPFNGPSVVFNRRIAVQLGGYPQVASNEDYCFWILFMKMGYIVGNIDLVLVHMRAGSELIKRRKGKRYAKGEFQSLKYLYCMGWISFPSFFFQITFRRILRLLPLKVLEFIYIKLLRS
jgi:glycosyltransferase involved in cell wall biosynthesis